MPQMGLMLWVPHPIHAIFQTLTLADKENGTSPEICWQVFHAQFGFGEILAWVSLLSFAIAECCLFFFTVFYPNCGVYSSVEGNL